MKTIPAILEALPFALTALLPLATGLASAFGFSVELLHVPLWAALTALAAVGAAACPPEGAKWHGARDALLAPLSLLSTAFYMLRDNSAWTILWALLCVCACVVLTIRRGRPRALQTASLAVFALLLLPTGFLGMFNLLLGDFGQRTVARSLPSPGGAYVAEVIDIDQGALGGDTVVDVHANWAWNAGLFRLSRKPQRVYIGDWGEFKTMNILWESDDCLIIDSVAYPVNAGRNHP